MTNDKLSKIELNKYIIESMIYEIRGEKVMLDFDLAKIYGYDTKAFNQQVRNNIGKFPERYRFQISKEEMIEIVRSKNLTSLKWSSGDGGRVYLPYAFTEQGIYMLMTVLKGPLAIKQSITLIDTFKAMKDYIIRNKELLDINEVIKLTNVVNNNTNRIVRIENKLEIVMDNFIDKNSYKHFIILDGEKLEADVAYQDIYKRAKKSIIVIDDYINIKTLLLLKSSNDNINITIISDNKARNSLRKEFIADSNLNLTFKRNNDKFHDRYIIIDYKEKSEEIFHCGGSSKDSGNKIGAINKLNDAKGYYEAIDKVLLNENYNIE